MRIRKALIPILIAINLLMSACIYVVLPKGLELNAVEEVKEWNAMVTGVSQTPAGDLHVDLTIRNSTGDWSTMSAVADKPAVLTTSDGKTHNCETVFVNTGGHRLAPGFQMRGYTGGTKMEPETQLIYVECQGVQPQAGASLAIDYVAYSGELDYYHQEEGESSGTMVLNLDEVASDLTYPIYAPIEGLVETQDTSITALSDCVINLVDVKRIENGLEFTWQNTNPTDFALKIHIGVPPVIGSDGILYGFYQSMDLAATPLVPAKGNVQWTTQVIAPQEIGSYYILLSVESKNMRLYVNHLIEISDQ